MNPTTDQTISQRDGFVTTDTSLLIYMTLMILLITLIPFRFHVPEKIEFLWKFNLKDFIPNILLFVPIGFLVGHSSKTSSRLYLKAIGYGLILSLVIEITQAFIVGRTTSAYDVIANGSGAFLGAWLFHRAKGRIEEPETFRVSSLQIPLVNLVLLLTPLLWLTSISSGNDPLRLYLLLLPLGIFGTGLPATMGASSLPEQSRLLTAIRLVEFIAAFAILGYVTAEMRGRKDQSPFPGLCLAFGISSALLVLIALIQGAGPITWKLFQHALPLVAASLYGGIMYRLQLAAFKRE